jgi:hypothetical protein
LLEYAIRTITLPGIGPLPLLFIRDKGPRDYSDAGVAGGGNEIHLRPIGNYSFPGTIVGPYYSIGP